MKKVKTGHLVIIFLSISFLCILAYYNSLTNPFIWDDEGLIVKNALIKNWRFWPKAFTNDLFFGSSSGSNFYRPLQTLSYIGDYFFWQLNPFGYHITNILLQILVSFLLFLFIFSISGNLIVAYSAVLLFAVNPLHTEAVSYISGRSDLLLGLFTLAALLVFIKSQEGGTDTQRKAYLYLSLLLFILALLAKELAAIFPLVILAYLFCYQRDGFKRPRSLIFSILPFFIIDAVYLILRLTILHFNTTKPPALTSYPFLLRVFVLPEVLLSYLKLLVFPLDLHMSRTFKLPAGIWPLLCLWFLLVIILLYLARILRDSPKYKTVSFLSLWFLLFLLPQSGMTPINAFIAEHFIYLSSISFFTLIAYALFYSLRRGIFILSLAGLVIFYLLLTVSRNAQWKYPVVFYEKLIELSPGSFMAHNNLGLEYQRRRHFDQAISEYKKALRIAPGLLEAHSNLASLYYETKDFKQSEKEYAIVERIAPPAKSGEVANNIAVLYEEQGLLLEAVNKYKLALQLDPNLEFVHFNLARLYWAKGESGLACDEILNSMPRLVIPVHKKQLYIKVIGQYLTTVKKGKPAPLFYNDLGVSFAASGLFDAAITSFRVALGLQPDYQDAHFNLALVYYKTGLKDKALAELRLMLKFKPGHKKAEKLLKEIRSFGLT